MTILCRLAPLSICVLPLVTAAVQAVPRPDAPDLGRPFLPIPARSVVQLVQEVKRDPVTAQRYARYFQIPQARVPAYLRRTLSARGLPRPGLYTVFFISASGDAYPTRMPLSAGTRVFARRDGVPILLGNTGNPLVPFAAPVETRIVTPSPPPERSGDPHELVVPAKGVDIPIAAPPR